MTYQLQITKKQGLYKIKGTVFVGESKIVLTPLIAPLLLPLTLLEENHPLKRFLQSQNPYFYPFYLHDFCTLSLKEKENSHKKLVFLSVKTPFPLHHDHYNLFAVLNPNWQDEFPPQNRFLVEKVLIRLALFNQVEELKETVFTVVPKQTPFKNIIKNFIDTPTSFNNMVILGKLLDIYGEPLATTFFLSDFDKDFILRWRKFTPQMKEYVKDALDTLQHFNPEQLINPEQLPPRRKNRIFSGKNLKF